MYYWSIVVTIYSHYRGEEEIKGGIEGGIFFSFIYKTKMISRLFSRSVSSSSVGRKVAVLGAAGGIGQPLSLLLKTSSSPSISHLALYDIANMGMSADLGHISTATRVTGHDGNGLAEALKGAEIVLIPAGVPRKPGMTRDDLFATNATIVRNLTAACAQYCPSAHILVISNPVNSTVPIAVETMKAAGISAPSVFGVTTLDLVRAKTFIGQMWGVDPQLVSLPVIGGHSGPTIVPLLSQVKVRGEEGNQRAAFTSEQVDELVKRIQYGGDEVVQAKAGSGSATLSMAYAAQVFFDDLCKALDSKGSVSQTAFVHRGTSTSLPTEYFATEIKLGPKGLELICAPPQPQTQPEKDLMSAAVNVLQKDISKGLEFAKNFELKQQTK